MNYFMNVIYFMLQYEKIYYNENYSFLPEKKKENISSMNILMFDIHLDIIKV